MSQSDADIFSRGSLKLTYDLLRKSNPRLALMVRNQLGGKPVLGGSSDNPSADRFQVRLDSLDVRAVVEALLACNQQGIAGGDHVGRAIMAKALLQEWLALAEKMLAELPDEQKPKF